MADLIQDTRDRIKFLEGKEEEARATRSQLREARNELAYLTGTVFVVVDDGAEARVYGVSPEVKKTEIRGLSFSLVAGDVVHIFVSTLDLASVTLFVAPGGQVGFRVTYEEGGATTYRISAFKVKADAKELAEQRRLANTSR